MVVADPSSLVLMDSITIGALVIFGVVALAGAMLWLDWHKTP